MHIKKATVQHFSVFHVGTLSYDVIDNRFDRIVGNYRSLSTAFAYATDCADHDRYLNEGWLELQS